MNRGSIIALAVAVALVVGIGTIVSVNATKGQRHREELAAEFQASGEAANRTLEAAGLSVADNGMVIQQ